MHTDNHGKVHFSKDFCNIVQSTEELIISVFPNIVTNYRRLVCLCIIMPHVGLDVYKRQTY